MVLTRATLLAGMAAAGTSIPLAAPARAADLVPVRLASAFQDDVGPLLWGIAAGVFTRLGLDVHVDPVSSGAVAAAAVAGGALHFAKSGPISLVTGHTRGVPFTIVEVPQSALVAALREGRIDLGTAQNPVLYDALEGHQAQEIANPFDVLGNRYFASCWFTTKDLVQKQADLSRRFVAGLKESTRYALAPPADIAAVLVPFLHDDAVRLRKMGLAPVGVDLVAKELQPSIDVASKYGLITKTFDASELITILS